MLRVVLTLIKQTTDNQNTTAHFERQFSPKLTKTGEHKISKSALHEYNYIATHYNVHYKAQIVSTPKKLDVKIS